MSIENSNRIEPVTFRFVVQLLKHCATAGPHIYIYVKGKTVPLQACTGPESARKLRLPDFVTTAQDIGKDVSLTHRPSLPQEILLVLISVRG